MQREQVEIIAGKNGYNLYLEEAKKLVDQEISTLAPQIADLELGERISYVLQTHGKRLRPVLVMLSAQSVGGNIEPVRKLALSIELLHTATLIHDDILDQDIFRRNAPTVNAKWGIRDALLVGDALASLSLNLAAEYGEEIVQILSRTCLLLSDGEYMDVESAHKKLKESDYLKTIERKSASLFKAATQCGAIAANAKQAEIDALAEFGESFGLAYQIRDDLSDVTALENGIPQDINEFRATLPIVYFCDVVEPKVREDFFEAINDFKSQRYAEKKRTLSLLRSRLEETGSLSHCINRINQYLDRAVASLKPVRKSVYKKYLIQMVDSLKRP